VARLNSPHEASQRYTIRAIRLAKEISIWVLLGNYLGTLLKGLTLVNNFFNKRIKRCFFKADDLYERVLFDLENAFSGDCFPNKKISGIRFSFADFQFLHSACK
jgi:hypothetical protein